MNNRLILIALLLSVIFFIVGLNVGMHGMVHSNTSQDNNHLWVRIPESNENSENGENSIRNSGSPMIVQSENNAATESNGISKHSDGNPAALNVVNKEVVRINNRPVVVTEPPRELQKHMLNIVPTKAMNDIAAKHNTPNMDKATNSGNSMLFNIVENVKGSHTIDGMIRKKINELKGSVVNKKMGSIHGFIESGGVLPIVILTCNRVELLDATIANLLQVRGVKKEWVVIVQDGGLQGVVEVAKKYDLKLIQNKQGLALRGGVPNDGGSRIATHYKYALSRSFDYAFPNAPGIIVVEDDLLFSPDFYEYFAATAPVLEYDKSLFIISSWNDNGLKGKIRNSFGLKRTEFFPGLGWFLTRELYKGELEKVWPTNHWDHWLRSPQVHKGREILYPEVPRTFHNGIKGTFMNMETHNRYFRDIGYNTDADVSWNPAPTTRFSEVENKQMVVLPQQLDSQQYRYIPPYITAIKDIYIASVIERFEKCSAVKTTNDLYDLLLSKGMIIGILQLCQY